MRTLAAVLACSLVAGGCAVNSYQIPAGELARLAREPPETRGQHVRVVQELSESDVPAAQPVQSDTQVYVGVHTGYVGPVGPARTGGGGGGSKIGGAGNDAKGAAIALLAIAATALVTAAIVEGTRYDGFAQLHPMHPVHLIGHDGSYRWLPLAELDPATAAATATAVVRPTEGPWVPLGRAPLTRAGLTYGLYGGAGSLLSAVGDRELGAAWTVQLGYFPSQQLGVLASVFFGWRDNRYLATLFETRYTAELQYLPLQVGILHGGVFGGAGLAYRFEDAIKLTGGEVIAGNQASGALVGGAMFQIDINTRVALTARLGAAFAHDERMTDALLGISVY